MSLSAFSFLPAALPSTLAALPRRAHSISFSLSPPSQTPVSPLLMTAASSRPPAASSPELPPKPRRRRKLDSNASLPNASPARRPRSSTSNNAPNEKKSSDPRPDNTRTSELTRKYRALADDTENELVGGFSPESDFSASGADAFDPMSTAEGQSSMGDATSLSAADSGVRQRAAAAAAMPFVANTRFPATWSKVVRQTCDCAMLALAQGHDRLLMSVNKPSLLVRAPAIAPPQTWLPAAAARSQEQPSPSFSTAHLYSKGMSSDFSLTIDICNALVARLCSGDAVSKGSRVRPEARIIVFFNSQREAEAARVRAHPAFIDRVRYSVLASTGPDRLPGDICIIVSPTNRSGDSSAAIEAVELIHYSNWNNSNIVIMLNPNLIALSGFNLDGRARPPSFLSDYVDVFFLDPAVYSSRVATGAILRCYPRKWELYMLRAKSPTGFRLVAEQSERPKLEKVLCDFAWRSEQFEESLNDEVI
jgi:Domain of unknown function (DUF1995)